MTPPPQSTRDLETHFRFGENWLDYSESVDATHLEHSVNNLQRLFATSRLDGLRFLDIGCGSGLHSVAAATLGAEVVSIDLDPQCITSTVRLGERFQVSDRINVEQQSVFDLDPRYRDAFDIVYSWGVLHHTGDMWTAIDQARTCVSPGGQFALAIYRKLWSCGAWRIEKYLYSKLPPFLQGVIRWPYTAVVDGVAALKRCQSPARFRREYKLSRGMSRDHDIHDWLGGYPYESASAEEIEAFMSARTFSPVRIFNAETVRFPRGWTGSGCVECVFQRDTESPV